MKVNLTLFAAFAAATAMGQSEQLTLQDALNFAKQNSPVLQAVKAELNAKLATAKGAKAMTGPQITANGFTKTGNNSSILSSPPKSEPSAQMQVSPGQFFVANLMLMLPLLSDDLRAMASATLWQAKAAAGQYREDEADLELAVREAYFMVKASQEDVEAAKAKMAALGELLNTTKAKFEAGSTIEASVQRVEAEVSRAERDFKTAKNAVAKSMLDLLQAIGGRLDAQIELPDISNPEPNEFRVDDLIRSALKNRGVLISSLAMIKAAEAELRAANAQGRPRVFATGMADATSRRDMGGLTFGLSVSMPLFDGGRVRSEVDKAKAMKTRADAEFEAAKLQVEKEVRQALLDYETALANMQSAESSTKAAAGSYEVISLRVDAGKAILLEQLDAMDVLTETRTDLAKARLELLTASARLNRATGGS